MRRLILGVAGGLLLFAVVAAVVVLGRTHAVNAGAPSEPPVVAVGTPGTPQPDMRSGQNLTPSDEASVVDSATAMATVRKLIRPAALGAASSITIGKYRFTSDELDESVASKNALVWVVTINGVNIPFSMAATVETTSGTRAPVSHQLNILIDANTGKSLVALTGMVTRD